LSNSLRCPRMGPNNRLFVATGSGHIIEFVEDTEKGHQQTKAVMQIEGQPYGYCFEKNGSLIICDMSSQSLVSADEKQEISTLCAEYENCAFQGPCNCIIDNKGRKYFTDSGPVGCTSLQSPKGSIFCIGSDGILKPLAYQCLAQPTGLCLSIDQKCLYVCEMLKNRIIRFVEIANGIFIYSVFFRFNGAVGPTGIDVDFEGNVYICRYEHKGLSTSGIISIVSPNGELISEISSLAPELSGLCCDRSSNTLYITELSTTSVIQVHIDDILSKNEKKTDN